MQHYPNWPTLKLKSGMKRRLGAARLYPRAVLGRSRRKHAHAVTVFIKRSRLAEVESS